MRDSRLFGRDEEELNLSGKLAFYAPEKEEKNAVFLAINDETNDDRVYGDIVVPSQNSIEVPDCAELDPWALVDDPDKENEENGIKPWRELSWKERIGVVSGYILRLVLLLTCLYLFIYSLDILTSAFRLLGGRAAGAVFRDSQLLRNPICGLMIGVLATVLVQSSSTSTSIVVSMVASEILDVRTAIPIVMGANIGTSMTNTLVSVAHSTDRAQFRRAFAGATVHDMFNWLTVIILLPIEIVFGYLNFLSTTAVGWLNLGKNNVEPPQLLTVLTKPLTSLTIQLDKSIIDKLATGEISSDNVPSLVKRYCDEMSTAHNNSINLTNEIDTLTNIAEERKLCRHIFATAQLSDTVIGLILLFASLAILIGCLIAIVKLLSSVLRGRVIHVVRRTINAELPGCMSFFTGYLAIIVGALMTIVVQSSSVFTSALTPLVGLGVLTVERMYPLTLGANVGTTFTSILAAMASPASTMSSALQISFCHLFFNISGILLFYPIPFMRGLPVSLAKLLGETTAEYRWFAVLYVVLMFFLFPAAIFGLSSAGTLIFACVAGPLAALLVLIILANVAQNRCPTILPKFLRDWKFLPAWMRSLEPYDRLVTTCLKACPCCNPALCCCKSPQSTAPQPTLKGSESRRKLLNTSVTNSRVPSRAPSPTRFVAARKDLLELIDEQATLHFSTETKHKSII